MTRSFYPTFFACFFTAFAFGQVPSIQSVAPLNAHPNDTILITGSGFDDDPTKLQVWFGQVAGEVVVSSAFAIEVVVPPAARLEEVTVLNKASHASAKSRLRFTPSFQGEPFSASKFNTTLVEGQNLFTSNEELWDISTADFDGDGKPDIVSTKFQSNLPFVNATDIMVLHNTGTPGSPGFTKYDKNNMAELNLNFPTDNVITGDLNGDGKPEIMVTRAGATRHTIHILRNTSTPGDISFAPSAPQVQGSNVLTMELGHLATRLRVHDLNRDGKPEIIATNAFNHIFYIFVNESSGETLKFNTTPITKSIRVFESDQTSINYEIEVADFDGDELPDLAVNEFQEDSIHIFRNTSAGSISFAPRATIPTTERLNRITTADLNADGKPDLIATSTLNHELLVFMNQSSGSTITFPSNPTALPTGNGTWGVDVADIDGDGDTDIINASRDDEQINIFTSDGGATPVFTPNTITTASPTRNVKVADIDGDGKPEVVYTSFNSNALTSALVVLRNTHCHVPAIINEDPFEICNGRTTYLETTPAVGVTFEWKKDNGTVGGDDHQLTITAPGAGGTYTVTATAEGGACVQTSEPIDVVETTGTAPNKPDITTNSPICTGGQLTLSTTDLAGATYEWTGPNGFTSTTRNPVVDAATQEHAGFYELVVTVGGCHSNVETTRVDVADMADFAITSNSTTNMVCAGDDVLLSVSNLTDHDYQWKLGGVDIGTATNPTYTAIADGDYTVTITNTVLNCTTDAGPVTVSVLTAPTASFTVDSDACTGESVTFTNTSAFDNRATVIYAWNFDDTNTSGEESPTHTYATAQTFDPVLTVRYDGVTGCTDNTTSPVTIVSAQVPDITADKLSICPDSTAALTVAGTFATLLWSTTETAAAIDVNTAGTYTVETTDTNGCLGTDEITIDALDAPVLTVTANRTSITKGDTTQLHVTGANTFAWTPVEAIIDPAQVTTANPIVQPQETTTFTVRGTAANGCAADGTIAITVNLITSFPLHFSPNADGINDEWIIGATDKPDCVLSVFDGRGRRVFEGRGQNWDGTSNGQLVPTGTYYYVFGCPNEEPKTGNVLIISN